MGSISLPVWFSRRQVTARRMLRSAPSAVALLALSLHLVVMASALHTSPAAAADAGTVPLTEHHGHPASVPETLIHPASEIAHGHCGIEWLTKDTYGPKQLSTLSATGRLMGWACAGAGVVQSFSGLQPSGPGDFQALLQVYRL